MDLVRRLLLLVVLATACVGLGACADDDDGSGESIVVDFSELRAEAIEPTRAVLRFRTSHETTSAVLWGRNADALINVTTATDATALSLEHEVALDGLDPDTTYHWRAQVELPDGTGAISVAMSFTTLPEGGTP